MAKRNMFESVALRVLERRLTAVAEFVMDKFVEVGKTHYEGARIPGRKHPLWADLNETLVNGLGLSKTEAKSLAARVLENAPLTMTEQEAAVKATQLRMGA